MASLMQPLARAVALVDGRESSVINALPHRSLHLHQSRVVTVDLIVKSATADTAVHQLIASMVEYRIPTLVSAGATLAMHPRL